MPVKLGYWNIRGLAEPIRYLLHYLQIEFEDKRYDFGPDPNFFDSEWSRVDKQGLGLELPNVPYYIDDDRKITQSMAIMRYLARKHHLYYPTSENEDALIRFESMEGHARDLNYNLAFMAYNPNFEQWKESFKVRVTEQIKAAADFLGDKVWVFGENISHVDFLLFEGLEALKLCFPDCCAPHENLRKFLVRFAELPGVIGYRATSLKWPLYSPFAVWGGRGDLPQ